jgi:ethanolamine kinase
MNTVGARVVFAHGDLKPSNMMRAPVAADIDDEGPALWFIDLELSGPNYRGFDIMKLFRADEGFSEPNLLLFLHTYLTSAGLCNAAPAEDGSPNDGDDDAHGGDCDRLTRQLYAEARMFEPLTWLEAAVFFVLVLAIGGRGEEETQRNYTLGKQRWQRYLASKALVTEYAHQASEL